jgi:hypothetical protein
MEERFDGYTRCAELGCKHLSPRLPWADYVRPRNTGLESPTEKVSTTIHLH